MYKAIIVDDERQARELLAILVTKVLYDKVEICATCASVNEAIAAIEVNNPNLVFLDVEMPGESGFSLFEKLEGRITFDVIFTTAHSKYALDAFKVNALDYILKPSTPQDLIRAINKIEERSHLHKELIRHSIMEQLKKAHATNRLGLPTDKGVEFIDVTTIVRCEASSNYTFIHLNNKQKIIVCRTLKQIEEALQPFPFFRIHKSHMVNLKAIKGYKKGDNSFVTLEDGTELPVSRHLRADFESMVAVV